MDQDLEGLRNAAPPLAGAWRNGARVRLARAVSSCLLLVALSGCATNGVLAPRGPVAAANKAIMLNALAIMLAIVVPTLIALVAFAWWFRAGNTRAHYDPRFVFSGRIEAIVWGVPLLTVIFLSGLIWIGSHRQDPYRPLPSAQEPLEVQVVSLDWKWLFIYPAQNVASLNKLVLPVGRPVRFSLTSSGVMNAFFVPQLGSQIYTMNGMTTQLHLQADEAGVYRGQSSHFSGDGFADMTFDVEAVRDDAFDRWVADAGASGKTLDAQAYAALAKQSQGDPPAVFGGVEAGLFDAIVTQRIAPAAGQQHQGGANPHVSPEAPR